MVWFFIPWQDVWPKKICECLTKSNTSLSVINTSEACSLKKKKENTIFAFLSKEFEWKVKIILGILWEGHLLQTVPYIISLLSRFNCVCFTDYSNPKCCHREVPCRSQADIGKWAQDKVNECQGRVAENSRSTSSSTTGNQGLCILNASQAL